MKTNNDENNKRIMEKLDKEAVTNKLWLEKKHPHIMVHNTFDYSCKAGLEYAENHYLKLIKEKDKENLVLGISFNQISQESVERQDLIAELYEELQQAKELLNEINIVTYKHKTHLKDELLSNKIEEFLKQ